MIVKATKIPRISSTPREVLRDDRGSGGGKFVIYGRGVGRLEIASILSIKL
jgi:hypothetical protein